MDPRPLPTLILALPLALTLAGGPTSIPSLLQAGAARAPAARGSRQDAKRSHAERTDEIRERLGELLLRPLRFPQGLARVVVTRAEGGDTEGETPSAPREAPREDHAAASPRDGGGAAAGDGNRNVPDEDGGRTLPEGPPRLFGVATPGGVALSWNPGSGGGRGGRDSTTGVRLYRWRRGERPVPLLEEPLAASAYLDVSAQPGWTYWYAVERLAVRGLERFSLARVRIADPAELLVVGGDTSGAWIQVIRTSGEQAGATAVFVKRGHPVADAAGTLVTSWRVQAIREIVLRREIERIEPVFRPDGRVALEVGGDRPLRATRTRWQDEPALEVVVENADGEKRTLVGPLGTPDLGKG